jgi:hypothetical protein
MLAEVKLTSSFYFHPCFKMSSSQSVKAVKVTATCSSIVNYLAALLEHGKCEAEDFGIWGQKFLELKVSQKTYVLFFFY